MRIGIDVGGTFTDVVMVDDRTGRFYFAKTSTTPGKLWEGTMDGIAKVMAKAGCTIAAVDYIAHGTTIGTNALIERKGAKAGLITTEGFVDVLEIGRVQRPKEALYNVSVENPPPLVPRYLRRSVRERVDAGGQVIEPLDEASARAAVAYLKEQGVESIAVSLLFSFMNPAHERRIAEIIGEIFPECYVSLSSEIAPEFREFERTSTTVINAYLQPVMKKYISRLTQELEKAYGRVDLRIMQASGGTITAEAAERRAINTVNSGPAGGVLAGAFIGATIGNDRLVSVDMGGTSFDIGLIEGGIPKVSSDSHFEGYPVKIPIIDIDTIGAGGGSIAWIDRGGALNVGPQSAGAQPGPACYRRGGERPTVTDANLVLGRINGEYFLGGEMSLDLAAARRAIETHIAKPLGLSVEEGAAGMIRIVNAKMAKGISVNSVEKGFDVREFALVAFGGAGPVHAAELAKELGMKQVVIPPLAGNLSAFGLLVSDARHDFVQTMVRRADRVDLAEANAIYRGLEERGLTQLIEERFDPKNIEIYWSADLRYEGQSYELNVPVARQDLSPADLAEAVRSFHQIHFQRYAYGSEDEPVQFVNLRVTAVGKNPRVSLEAEGSTPNDGRSGLKGRRRVHLDGVGSVEAPIYERNRLSPGAKIEGPAIIEEEISGTLVLPGTIACIDQFRNLIVKVG